MKLSPGCNCCGGGTPPGPGGDNCETVYGQTWKFGTATYMKTFHRDFTATYLDYVQTEERSFDAGNNPTGTVVVGQVYNNNYSSAGAATESSESDAFFSGEFIANPVDTFVSENFVSTVPDGLGGVIETWEVHYNRQADVRESTGLAFFRSVYFTEDAEAETSKLKAQYYVNDDTSGASGQYTLAGRDNKTATLVATADHLTRAASSYSVDPGSIGGIKVNAFSTNIKGETQAAIEAITTAAGAQALRGASGPGLYESFYWSGTETQSIFDVSSVTNGSEPTFTLLGEKPTTVTGPAGGGWAKSRIVCGWEDYFNNTPLWGTYPERPEFGIWELVTFSFGSAYDITVPAEHGFRITADEAYQTRYTNIEVMAGTTYGAINTAFGNGRAYQGGAFPEGLLTRSVDRSRLEGTGDFINLPEAGVYPLPISQDGTTLFSREFEFAWSKDVLANSLITGFNNFPHVKVDSGTDWSARFAQFGSATQMMVSLPGEDETSWFWNSQDLINSVYTGGDYLVRITDNYKLQATDSITIVKYNGISEGVTCEEIPECSTLDDLSSLTAVDDWRDHARFAIPTGGTPDTLSLNTWYQNVQGVSNTSKSIVTGEAYQINIINRELCTSELFYTFDGTYTQDEGVMDYKVTLSGTKSNMTWETTFSLKHWMSGSVLDGPYTCTVSGINLGNMITNFSTNGELYLYLGIGQSSGGTLGNDKAFVREGTWSSGGGDILFDGTMDLGSTVPIYGGTTELLIFAIEGGIGI